MNKLLIILVLVAVLGGGYYVMTKGQSSQEPTPTDAMTAEGDEFFEEDATESYGTEEGATLDAGTVKEFTVEGTEFAFDLKTITVNKGDTVKINFTNGGKYTHDWVVDEFGARTKVINGGESDSVTFVADQVGSFEYYCSVMQHRKQGMVGQLVVEE